tara:strand:- start:7 stop:450 length:444 start_codon:yes stop_codon:yes gene_type:complete
VAKFRVLQHNLSSRDVFSILILTYIRPHCILLRDKWEKSGGGEGKRLLAFAKRRKTVTRKPRFFRRGGEFVQDGRRRRPSLIKKGEKRRTKKKLSLSLCRVEHKMYKLRQRTHHFSLARSFVPHTEEREREREKEKEKKRKGALTWA